MKCYEFNDGCGIHFGIIANNKDEAVRFAVIDCEEEAEEYEVRELSDEEALRREIMDEDSGRLETIYSVLSECVASGNTGPAMLWHSEA